MEIFRSIIADISGLFRTKKGLILIVALFALFSLLIKFLKPRWLMRKIGLVRTRTRRVYGRTRYRRRYRSRRRRR